MSKKVNLASAVVYGISAWLAYAVVEFILFSLVPLVTQRGVVLGAPFWRAMAMLFAAYALIGAALGAVSSVLFHLLRRPDQTGTSRSLLIATLPLPIAFVANLLGHWPLTGSGAIAVLVGILLIAAMAGRLRSSATAERLAFLTGPFAVSTLLLLTPWIGNDVLPARSSVVRLAAIAGATMAAVLLFHLLYRLRRWAGDPRANRYAMAVVGSLALVCATAGGFSAPRPGLPPRGHAKTGQRPNVVLIVMDTVRADHTSLYGYERDTTPFLRELAQEATLYTRTVAASDMTLSTHASMFTGLYPRTHGAHYAIPTYPYGRPLAERFSTMAELLQISGYRTMAEVSNTGYVSKAMGLSQGFELFDARTPVGLRQSMEVTYLRRQVRELLDRLVSTTDFEPITRRAGEINQDVYAFLDQIGDDSPFFLFVNYMDAHDPYAPPAPFDRMYPCADPKSKRLERFIDARHEVMSSGRPFSPQERECWISGYDGGIAYLDNQVRSLVASLRARGLFENTLLIVTGDHGESFGERNQLGHGISVYQDEVRVPLLVKYPAIHSAIRIDALASQVDLLPTVLDVASLPTPPGLQGVSLRNLQQRAAEFVVSEAYPDPWLIRQDPRYERIEEALLFKHAKLLASTSGKRELYNLSADVDEEHNLYREGDPDAALMTKLLDEWHRTLPAFTSTEAPGKDRDTMDRLKSLGYAQ